MITNIRKWGHSLAFRIPKSIADELGLEANSPVEIKQEKGKLTLIPFKKKEYSLDEMLAQITPENLHAETGTGKPVGNEVW